MRRTASTRLALRIIAGTGRAGALRVAVLVAAMAIAVATGLVIAFVPAIAAHRDDVAVARAILPARSPDSERFRAEAADASVGDRPLRRTFLADVPRDLRPPGAEAAPGPGEVLVSPALRRLLREQPFVRAFVPGKVVGTVTEAGLADPTELFAYVGVADATDLTPAAGFGAAGTVEGGASSFVALQLALFVLIPAGGFLVVAATLSSRARSRRWDALRSASVPEHAIRHVGALETGLASIAGSLVGLLVFSLVRLPLTGAGIGGLRWFPADLRLTPRIAATTVVVVAAVGALLGRRATRLHATDSIHDPGAHRYPKLRAIPLVAGVTMLTTTVLVRHTGRAVNSAPILLASALLATIGLGLVLVPVVRGTGEAVARRARGLAWRLGGHRAAYEPRSIVRILAGLVALTVIGHLTFAVLADLRVAVGGDLGRLVASTSTGDLTAGQVDELLALRPLRAPIGRTAPDDAAGATIAYLDCAVLVRVVATPGPCHPGDAYRVADRLFPSDLEAGRTYRFLTQAGGTASVVAPAASAIDQIGMLDTGTIVVARARPPEPLAIGEVRYLVDRADLLRLESQVAGIDARTIVDSRLDVAKIEAYDQQRAVARVGAALGGLLATLCFVVASVDRLLERRSHVATLVAIGVPRSTLRASQIAQLLLPLAAALGLANVVGWLIGQAYLATGGIVQGLPVGLLAQGVALSAVALLIATVVGAIVSIPDDVATHLRAE